MRQYNDIKDKHPDKIVLFRMGDFYEMFGDDAVRAAPILGIALTSRSHGDTEKTPLAGVPYHAVSRYLARLLAIGEKVVVVEQVEDPKTAKGIVRREIVEILTPGTATVENDEDWKKLPMLVAVCDDGSHMMGLAALDLSTGSFVIDEGLWDELTERIKVLEPTEILYPLEWDKANTETRLNMTNGSAELTGFEGWNFDFHTAERDLNRHFGTATLEGFGVSGNRLAVTAAGAIFRYLRENHRDGLSHINRLTRFDDREFMSLDYTTVRNLELTSSIAGGGVENSLFSIINHTLTTAGARRLKNNLLRPFKTKDRIERRLSGVAELTRDRNLAIQIREFIENLPDLEKLAGRLGICKLNPRQMASIGTCLKVAKEVAASLKSAHSPHLTQISGSFPDCDKIIDRLASSLTDEPPLTSTRGEIFQRGYSKELDDLNDSISDARTYIGSLQEKERQRTGIGSLKVGFNKVFGYYLEVTKANSDSVPDEYIRKQTLVNAERYITPELKKKEELIFSAEEKIFRLEEELYRELVNYIDGFIGDIINTGDLLAEVDLVSSLAELAVQQRYCRPEIFDDGRLVIEGGRHPVVEAVLSAGSFVANDSTLSADTDRIQILTGPNMSGKSTYLRQVGLIVIMAQIGSFVPAGKAEIGLVDRVFTRVGALDNLARGQSTFLVEMVETANILHNATERSLVLLDEVGRGTSTFDGLSVAWAVVEFVNEKIGARTIFATHYHELTSLAGIYEHVRNYQVAVKEWQGKVIFLHQIIPGGCDDSYGVEVARLAGLPRQALKRAGQILRLLESGKFNRRELGKGVYRERVQPSLFEAQPSRLEQKIKDLDPDNMTPIEALNLLKELKKEID